MIATTFTGKRIRSRRAPLEIEMHMMEALRAHNPLGPTKLMYTANLSWDLMKKHVSSMVDSGLIATTRDSQFILTQRGSDCLALLEQGALMMGPLPEIFPRAERELQARYLDDPQKRRYTR